MILRLPDKRELSEIRRTWTDRSSQSNACLFMVQRPNLNVSLGLAPTTARGLLVVVFETTRESR